jgi:hypothetical protein
MVHPLDGARFKIVRAQEHLDAFNREGGAFLDTNPYRVESEVYGEHWWVKPHISAEPPIRLSAIVGDCVTNARAALDYIMWELAGKHFVPVVDLSRGEDRRITAFPIAESGSNHKGYRDRLDRLANRKIPAGAITEIKNAQPDVSGNQSLLWLHQLVNHDKHRMPILTVGAIGDAQIGIEEYKGKAWLIRSPIIKDGVAIKTEPEMLARLRRNDVKVNIDALVYITCSDLTMPREPLDRTLEQIIKTVADLIPRFDPFFP